MTKPEWGAKHLCPSCDEKFYDMGREPPTCPVCGGVVKVGSEAKGRRAAAAEAAPAPKAARPEVEATLATRTEAGAADLESPEVDGGAIIEDVTELGEDEHDMAEVLEGGVGVGDES